MAIAFDAVASGTNSNLSDTLTFAHTCTGSDRILFVAINCNNADNRITGVTYNGVSMTVVDSLVNSAGNSYLDLYVLVGPATGANNIVVTANTNPTNITAASISFTGASQTGQPDAHGTVTSSVASGGTQTKALTTIADNCWMLSYAHGAGDQPNASTNFTARVSIGNARLGTHTSSPLTPAGSHSMSVTNSGAGAISLTMLSASLSPSASVVSGNAFFMGANF